MWRETFKSCEDTVSAGIDAAWGKRSSNESFLLGSINKQGTLANAVVRP
jgi:hypothetical protein